MTRTRLALAAGFVLALRALLWSAQGLPTAEAAARCDFRAFYTAGAMVVRGDGGSLYDLAAQQATQWAVFPMLGAEDTLVGFFNPPAVALLAAPFALLPPGEAFAAWLLAWDLVWVVAFAMALGLGRWRQPALFAAVLCAWFLFPPVILTRVTGQLVPPLLIGLLGAVAALERGAPRVAGGWAALVMFKPHYGLLAALWGATSAGRGAGRFVQGLLLGALAWTALSLPVGGPAVLWRYPAFLIELTRMGEGSGLVAEHDTTLRGLWLRGTEGGATVGWAITAGLALGLALLATHRLRHDPRRAALVGLAAVLLVAPHGLYPDHALQLVGLSLVALNGPAVVAAGLVFLLHWVGVIEVGLWPSICLITAAGIGASGLGGASSAGAAPARPALG